MPADNYSDMDEPTTATSADDSKDGAEKEKDYEDSEQTALLPKAFFKGDVEPGRKCSIEVVHCYESEIECRYSESSEPVKKRSQMSQSEDALDGMAKMPD